MRKWIIVFVLCAAVLSVTACGGRTGTRHISAEHERIIGMWEAKWLRSSGAEAAIDDFTEAVGMNPVDIGLDFMDDGTLDASYNEHISHGTWEVSDAENTYTITVDGRSGDIVWEDETLTLEIDGTAMIFVRSEE